MLNQNNETKLVSLLSKYSCSKVLRLPLCALRRVNKKNYK